MSSIKNIIKIWYENKWRKVDVVELNHIHLDGDTVIEDYEIICIPFTSIAISKYSEKKQIKNIFKHNKKILYKMLKSIRKQEKSR